ncbi:MAG TPA: VRR-NUC domain-containing protein [Thermomicrobiaceae bacterium]|nr:VRR-NUC domain-containing protein [Thermomicrobiaceae bacterium]
MAKAAEATMTESQLQDAIAECARMLGYLVAHFRPARTATGWRTATQYDATGFPDLVLVSDGQHRLLFVECKRERGRLSGEQAFWCTMLAAAGQEFYVWRPADWLDGTVETVLRGEEAA